MNHHPQVTKPALAAVLLAALLAQGCKSVGPRTVAQDRSDYSRSIAESWKRQTLLNIVKLRYMDPPMFVDVGQIVAGYSLETGIAAGGSLPETTSAGGNTVTLGGSARFTDRPTITYVPLTGNHFVRALMTPLPPEAVFFMIQSGWPADGVLMAATASINGLKNQETSISGVTPPDPGFMRMLELMRSLQKSGAASLRVVQGTNRHQSSVLALRAEKISEQSRQESLELRELLGLDSQAREFSLVLGGVAATKNEIAVITRSILHIMTTMAAQVEVPARDVEEGRATPGVPQLGNGIVPGSLLQIHSSNKKPGNAFAVVQYRDTWFWIDDRDLKSKRAFAFMLMLFTLSDSGHREDMPMITIPAQ